MRLLQTTVQTLVIAAITLNSTAWAYVSAHAPIRAAMLEMIDRHGLPSLSLAIGEGDVVQFADALGYADLADEQRATVSTQYSVASLAKPMTAIALASLASLGLIDLDKPVADYLPRPSYLDRFSVRELASHLAGLPHDTPGRRDAEFANPVDRYNPFEVSYVFEEQELLFEPGTDFHYSSDGYILLSALIERVAEEGFMGYLRGRLWPSLDMTSTALDISGTGQNSEASYYSEYYAEDDYTESTTQRDRSFLFGAGGFLSTPTDLVKMARATYAGGVLPQDARQSFYTPTPLRSGLPNPGNYALGWQVGRMQLSSNQPWLTLQHAGLLEGSATSFLFVVPECRQSIAFATNRVPERFWELYREIELLLKQNIDEGQCRRFAWR